MSAAARLAPAPIAALAAALLATLPAAPAAAQNASTKISVPAEKLLITPGGVDLRTGQYQYNETDLRIGPEPADGGLTLTRTALADVPEHVDPFGNMSHNWDISIQEVRINLENGAPGTDYRAYVYIDGRTDTFEAPSGAAGFHLVSQACYGRLTYSGDRASPSVVYTYTGTDGTSVTFRPMGSADCSRLGRCASASTLVRPDGTRFTFGYVSEATLQGNVSRLAQVVSSRGYALLLEGGGGLVTKACVLNLAYTQLPAGGLCPANAQGTASYTYSGSRLASANDQGGATWRFTYAAAGTNGLDMGFVKPGQTTPWLTNRLALGADERGTRKESVVSQTFADGQLYTYSSGYTDALGNTWDVEYGDYPLPNQYYCYEPPCSDPQPDMAIIQTTSGPTVIRDPLNRATLMDYCDPISISQGCYVTLLQSFTDPEGIKTYLKYDGYRNILQARRVPKPGSGLAEIVVSSTYKCDNGRYCAKPWSVTDGKGNVTDFTYAPEHGGLLTKTDPAVNGVRPQTRNAYVERRAWILAPGGGYQQASTGIWLLASTSLCRTSAATGNPASPCAVAGDEVRTVYDYGPESGPDNLLLRGMAVTADGKTLRTCYSSDPLGRRLSETLPNANLGACP